MGNFIDAAGGVGVRRCRTCPVALIALGLAGLGLRHQTRLKEPVADHPTTQPRRSSPGPSHFKGAGCLCTITTAHRRARLDTVATVRRDRDQSPAFSFTSSPPSKHSTAAPASWHHPLVAVLVIASRRARWRGRAERCARHGSPDGEQGLEDRRRQAESSAAKRLPRRAAEHRRSSGAHGTMCAADPVASGLTVGVKEAHPRQAREPRRGTSASHAEGLADAGAQGSIDARSMVPSLEKRCRRWKGGSSRWRAPIAAITAEAAHGVEAGRDHAAVDAVIARNADQLVAHRDAACTRAAADVVDLQAKQRVEGDLLLEDLADADDELRLELDPGNPADWRVSTSVTMLPFAKMAQPGA